MHTLRFCGAQSLVEPGAPEADDVEVADGVPGCAGDLLHGVCRTPTFSLRILKNGSAVMFPQEKSSTNIKVCLQPSGTDLRTRIKCPKDDFVKKFFFDNLEQVLTKIV